MPNKKSRSAAVRFGFSVSQTTGSDGAAACDKLIYEHNHGDHEQDMDQVTANACDEANDIECDDDRSNNIKYVSHFALVSFT